VATPSGLTNANIMIGYDTLSVTLTVAHWLDVFGRTVSETLGYGTRSGDQIEFISSIPDGPLSALSSVWMADKTQWQWQNADEEQLRKMGWSFPNLTLHVPLAGSKNLNRKEHKVTRRHTNRLLTL